MDIDQATKEEQGVTSNHGSKHRLRSKVQTRDLQEATADPRMAGVAGTQREFNLMLDFETPKVTPCGQLELVPGSLAWTRHAWR